MIRILDVAITIITTQTRIGTITILSFGEQVFIRVTTGGRDIIVWDGAILMAGLVLVLVSMDITLPGIILRTTTRTGMATATVITMAIMLRHTPIITTTVSMAPTHLTMDTETTDQQIAQADITAQAGNLVKLMSKLLLTKEKS